MTNVYQIVILQDCFLECMDISNNVFKRVERVIEFPTCTEVSMYS